MQSNVTPYHVKGLDAAREDSGGHVGVGERGADAVRDVVASALGALGRIRRNVLKGLPDRRRRHNGPSLLPRHAAHTARHPRHKYHVHCNPYPKP